MEGSSQNSGVDSMANQNIFEVVKRRKLESVPDPDTSPSETAEDFSKQSTTHELENSENSSESDFKRSSFSSDVTPQEFAFLIDDVFEQILDSLDHTSLLTCRLVSRRWRLSSNRVIDERADVTIIFKYSPTDQHYAKQRTAGDAVAAHNSTLEDLTRFLKDNYGPKGPFDMIDFPCDCFNFLDGSLSDPQLQSFLTTFGEYIFILFLDFSNSPKGESETTLIKLIGHLLNTQAPDLWNLYLYPSSKLEVAATYDIPNGVLGLTDSELSTSIQNNQESKEIKSQGKSGLREFRSLTCPRKILDYIISISPSLEEISLSCQDYHILSSPPNRLHFLKEFDYGIGKNDIFDFKNFKLFEAALCAPNEERETLKLPPIQFSSLNMDLENIADLMSANPDIRICFVSVINKILELSWDTLESISLMNHKDGTLTGIKWPRVLPNVSELDLRSRAAKVSGLELFPWGRKFKIQETFPKLNTLKLSEVIDYKVDVSISSPGEFLRNCTFGPAPNVKFVEATVYLYQNNVARGVKRFQSDVRNSLVRLFPSAKLMINRRRCF